jgi:hypothetical protein
MEVRLMIKSKAIDIISTFEAKEFNEFGKFINSPFFNTNSKLVELYSLLKKNFPSFSKKSFNKENIYKNLFPGKNYNDSTMKAAFRYAVHSRRISFSFCPE